MKARSLQDLAAMREALLRHEAEAAAQRASEAAAARRAEAQRRTFADAIGRVQPLPDAGRAAIESTKPEALPRQRERDERAALREALSDEVDVESLLLTDDGLSFRRETIGADVVARLRRGQWSVQAQLDLHGLRRDAARDRLVAFVRDSLRQGHRCVRVVHGKGLGSPGREPVLKAKVQRWLAQNAQVIAFTQATAAQGGAGALLVLLERGKPAG